MSIRSHWLHSRAGDRVFISRNREIILVVLLTGLTGWAQMHSVSLHFTPGEKGGILARFGEPDDVVRNEVRFAPLRSVLDPEARLVVGYLSSDARGNEQGFFFAQYALAPLLIDRSLEHEIVLGNFYGGASRVQTALSQPGFVPLANGGNGVILLQRKGNEKR